MSDVNLETQRINAFRDYYSHAELVLPENPRFHQFRVQVPDGHFKVLCRPIRSSEDLRKRLMRLAPLNCWESANMFLSPSNVSFNDFRGKRAGWQVANNILLGDGVLVFDTDFHDRSFDEAKTDALTILDYLHELGLKEDRVTFTGRGFQILVLHHDLHLPQVHPKARFNLYREKRKPIIEELQKRGVQIDPEITLDSKRIIRTVGTINSKSGHICIIIKALEHFNQEDAERVRLQGIPQATVKVDGMTSFLPYANVGADPNLWKGVPTPLKLNKPEQPTPAILPPHLIEIVGKGVFPFRVPPNHLILVSEMLCHHQDGAQTQCQKHLHSAYIHKTQTGTVSFANPYWISAEMLTGKRRCNARGYSGHYLVIPRLKGTCNKRHLNLIPFMIQNARANAGVKTRQWVTSLPLTPDVAWFLGMYVAEGSSDTKHIYLSINVRESTLRRRIHKIGKALGYSVYDRKPVSNCITCVIASRLLARAMPTWCGKFAENKHVPDFILTHCNGKIIRAFLSGYADGDGCNENQRGYNVLRVGCASQILVSQLQLLYARLGIWAGAYISREYSDHSLDYRLHSRLREKNNQIRIVGRVFDNAIFVPINHINKVDCQGQSHTLETNDGAYLVSNVIVQSKPNEPNPETSTPDSVPTIYLGTFVIGTLDRQVIMLRFPSDTDVKVLSERLSRFAMRERLAPFLIFRAHKDPDAIYGFSPSAIQFDGMKRLLRKFPENRATLAKFKRRIVPLPIEPLSQTSGIVDTEKPISRAHFKYLNHYGLASYAPKVLCGNMILSTPIGEMSA